MFPVRGLGVYLDHLKFVNSYCPGFPSLQGNQNLKTLTEVGGMGLAAFGAPGAGAFGQQQQNGTRTIPFQRVQEVDGSSSTGSKTPVYLQSISAMQPYANKSFEELRWEDYQVWTCARNAPYLP
jgi:hypothetical protein